MHSIKPCLTAVLIGILSACAPADYATPSITNTQPIETRAVTAVLPLDAPHHYARVVGMMRRAAVTPVTVIAVYNDPAQKNAADARAQSAAAILRRQGIGQHVIPMTLRGETTGLVARAGVLEASASSDCTRLPTLHDAGARDSFDLGDYKLGCGVDDLLSQQVARIPDLEGRSRGAHKTDGDRAAGVLSDWRAGTENEDLGGLTSSTVAEQE